MALPFDDAYTWLTSTSASIRQVYRDGYPDMYQRFGKRSAKLFKFSRRKIDGDGINVQVRSFNMNGMRGSADVNGDFPAARNFGSSYFKVLLSEDPATNHFRRYATSLQITDLDLERKYSAKVSSNDFVTDQVEQAMGDQMQWLAQHRHLDSTARLASVSGTAKKNDALTMAAASALTTSGGARFLIANGSLSYFQPGQLVDIYSGSTSTKRYTVQVTDYNPADGSVGVYGINSTTGALDSTVSLSAVASGDYIYINGEKDQNILSMGHWYSTPTASESFFGRDRTDVNYRYLACHQSGPSSSTQFSKTHTDALALELGYVTEEDQDGAYVTAMQPELEQRYRNEIGADIIIQYPTKEQQGQMMAEYGFQGSIYRHPQLGRIILNADASMIPGKIRFLKLGDWEMLAPLGQDFKWMPGDNGSNWYRMQSSTVGAGRTTTYQMNGYGLAADICVFPRRNAQINNLTA